MRGGSFFSTTGMACSFRGLICNQFGNWLFHGLEQM
jgi:hypothetical protein